MITPHVPTIWLHVDRDFCAKGCHGCRIEGEQIFEHFVCQEQRILMTQTEHVEGGIALWCELAPVCYGKRVGKACHSGEEMIFPGAYGPFGKVRAMDVRRSLLDACLFGSNNSLNVLGSFVAGFMEERFEAAKSEPGIDLTIGVEKFFF
jgi:hypothetical protein